jgi:acetolactate synthase-1/2/3 large subunit
MVDASQGEMDKFDGRGIAIGLRIKSRLDDFIPRLLDRLPQRGGNAIADWTVRIGHWRKVLPDDRPACPPDEAGFVDAYDVVGGLSDHVPEGEPLFVDTGGNLTWTCNGFRVRAGQRLISAWNNTPMGYALPAAIGAAAWAKGPVTSITGDGGLMICLAELATLVRMRLPIRVILFNNHGHGIQRQTLETWLAARYVGVDSPSGLAFPDFAKVASAMGLKTLTIDRASQIEPVLRTLYASDGPVFCNVEINPDQKLHPVLKFGAPLEDQLPALDPKFIREQMIVDPFVRNN